MVLVTNDNILVIEGNERTLLKCETVRRPIHVGCTRIGEEPDQTNTDNSTNYCDAPKYVVDVLGRVVSQTCRRLPESRNHRHVITTLLRAQVVTVEAA